MMLGFKEFLVETQINQEIKDTIDKLPKAHQKLVKGFKFKFFDGCTLKGSKENIGMIYLNNEKKKEIHIAAPWNYGRQFAMLHEIAHLVYEEYMTNNEKLKKKWSQIVQKTDKKLKQSEEELWCNAYAVTYCNQPPTIHNHPEWIKFIKTHF